MNVDRKKINIGKIIPISTVDWHGRSATTIFFSGCPFRCNYCQNHKLLDCKKFVDISDVEKSITGSEPFISTVVFSGGEPTMQPKGLIHLAEFVKNEGLAVGIQTNGYFPDVLDELVRLNLVDKIFLDIKTDLLRPDRYSDITNGGLEGLIIVKRIIESLRIGIGITEVRTTIFRYLNESLEIARYLVEHNFGGTYVLQQGLPWNALDKKIRNENILKVGEMRESAERIRDILKKEILKTGMNIKIRTREKGEETIS